MSEQLFNQQDNQHLTKKQRKKLRRQERLSEPSTMQKSAHTRRIIIWTITILVLGGALFGMIKLATYQSNGIVKAVTLDDWSQGNKQAPAVLIEYSDFQCPACGAYYPIIKQLQQEIGPDKLLFVYRNFPLFQIHPNAELAARTAEAAGKQNKFWEMHDRLFDTQQTWESYDASKAQDTFITYAENLKLNKDQFIKDLNSPEVKQAVQDDIQSGEEAKVDATPTFFLNGKTLPLASSYEEFKKIIEQTVSTSTTPK